MEKTFSKHIRATDNRMISTVQNNFYIFIMFLPISLNYKLIKRIEYVSLVGFEIEKKKDIKSEILFIYISNHF